MKFFKYITCSKRRLLIADFSTYLIKKLFREEITVVAGYLSYVTLMSLVPLAIVIFSILTIFPEFSVLIIQVEQFVYEQFVPTASELIHQHLSGFVENASKMSAVAIFILFLAALLLISAIDTSLNKIWRVTNKRKWLTSFAIYWLALTFGPLLIGISIATTSYLTTVASNFGFLTTVNVTMEFVPWFISMMAFYILYSLVPNTTVPFKYAIIGAVIASLLFEIAKKSFAIYVVQLPSYQTIYGALATIPILFLWVYISWLIVLSGAVLTVSLQNYTQLMKSKALLAMPTNI